ncbi:hypothetical protein PAPYR_8660 [Paratrimastix pyriformis]|uniref:Uncharacterized protein n=1 Tax=Paratrimastix pyriformis TaxID=342808 RepID=A0ABQ8UCW5_9EUKA|nr:hypothetical protein PAPYR_8660 [Paratrimastix pyriformis]
MDVSSLGIVQGHAYSILAVQEEDASPAVAKLGFSAVANLSLARGNRQPLRHPSREQGRVRAGRVDGGAGRGCSGRWSKPDST